MNNDDSYKEIHNFYDNPYNEQDMCSFLVENLINLP